MSTSLEDKFEKIELILNSINSSFKVGYIIEPIVNSPFIKKFQLKSLRNNQLEINEIGLRINEILMDPNVDAINSKEFVQLSNKMKFLSEEFVSYGEIIAYLANDTIRFEIKHNKEEPKIFIFTEEEYWDSLTNYLEKDFKQKVIMKNVE